MITKGAGRAWYIWYGKNMKSHIVYSTLNQAKSDFRDFVRNTILDEVKDLREKHAKSGNINYYPW